MDDKVKSRDEWLFDVTKNDMIINCKDKIIQQYITRFFNFTNQLFDYKNLPETIPKEYLELMIQKFGKCTIADVNGDLYALDGLLGGVYNAYYLPTLSVVANPYLKLSKTYTIDKDCIIIRNDTMYQGLFDLIRKYAELLAECDITIKYALYNARIPFLAVADDDNTKESFDEFYKKIIDGAEYGIPMQRPMEKSLQVENTERTSSQIKDIMEIRQYYIASFMNEIGLNSNYNMKREAINENESAMNDDILQPFIQTMLYCRKEDVKKVNEMFGTNIEVELANVWKLKEEILDAKVENVGQIVDEEKDGEVHEEVSEEVTE